MIALAIILAALVLIALIPAGVRIGYDENGLQIRVMVGWLGVQLYPLREKKLRARKLARQQKKQQKKRMRKQIPEEKPEVKPARGIGGIRPLLKLAAQLLGDMRRKLLVREIYLRVWFGGTDAARCAIHYGQAWAMIGGVMPMLENMFHIQNRDIAAELNQTMQHMEISARLDLRMRIGTMTVLGAKMGFRFIKILIKQKKAVQKNESSSV